MIWIGIGILFIGVFINLIVSDEHPGVYFGTILVFVGAVLMTTFRYEIKPSAMDVYQGKTTLEITYKDSVAVDSVVVFKNDKK